MNNYHWQCNRFLLDLSTPKVMGIVNITPDSFSDGGTYSQSTRTALNHAEKLLSDGADILDIGGESTRPGSAEVLPQDEWNRVKLILAEVSKWNVPVSLDTRRTFVMKQALESGYVDIINDVAALSDEGAVECVASYPSVGVCLMHMQGEPKSMQQQPQYQDVVSEIVAYLRERVAVCETAGIERSRLILDPGFGFGKTLQHNIDLMRHLSDFFSELDLPLLIGVSRKRMIGELTGKTIPIDRMAGSVAAALASVARGAQVVRVHDVKETVDAIKVWQALGVFAR